VSDDYLTRVGEGEVWVGGSRSPGLGREVPGPGSQEKGGGVLRGGGGCLMR